MKREAGDRLTIAGDTAFALGASAVMPGAASQVVFTTQPSANNAVALAFSQQPVVKIEDAYGNVVTATTDPFAVTMWPQTIMQFR